MVFTMLDHTFGPKVEVFDCCMKKPKYSYNEAPISFYAHHVPKALTTSVKMVLFGSLGQDSDIV